MTAIVLCYGYSSFRPWDIETFFTYYAMVIFAPILFIFWKVLRGTKVVPSAKADLIWERIGLDVYESTFIDPPSGFWKHIADITRWNRSSEDVEAKERKKNASRV